MPVKNLEKVNQYLIDAKLEDLIPRVHQAVEDGRTEFNLGRAKRMERGLMVAAAKFKTGSDNESLFYNGFEGTFIKGFKHVKTEEVNTEKLFAHFENPPSLQLKEQDPDAYKKAQADHLNLLATEMPKVATANEFTYGVMMQLFHLPDNNPAFPAVSDQIKEQIKAASVTRFFPTKEKFTVEEANRLLFDKDMPRYVYKEYHNAQGPYGTWMRAKFEADPTTSGNMQLHYNHDKYGFNLEAKLKEFDLPDLVNEKLMKEKIDLIKSGGEALFATNHPSIKFVAVTANVEKFTVHIRGGEKKKLLGHDQFKKKVNTSQEQQQTRQPEQATPKPGEEEENKSKKGKLGNKNDQQTSGAKPRVVNKGTKKRGVRQS